MHLQERKSNQMGQDRGSHSPASCALPLLALEAREWYKTGGEHEGMLPHPLETCVWARRERLSI